MQLQMITPAFRAGHGFQTNFQLLPIEDEGRILGLGRAAPDRFKRVPINLSADEIRNLVYELLG